MSYWTLALYPLIDPLTRRKNPRNTGISPSPAPTPSIGRKFSPSPTVYLDSGWFSVMICTVRQNCSEACVRCAWLLTRTAWSSAHGETNRLRAALNGNHTRTLGVRQHALPALELGVHSEGGDGSAVSGAAVLAGPDARWCDATKSENGAWAAPSNEPPTLASTGCPYDCRFVWSGDFGFSVKSGECLLSILVIQLDQRNRNVESRLVHVVHKHRD